LTGILCNLLLWFLVSVVIEMFIVKSSIHE